MIMSEENISQEFRSKKWSRWNEKLSIEEINQIELMSKSHKKVYRVLTFIEHLLILISTVTGCVFIYVFTSLIGIPIVITSSATGLKNCVINAGIKNFKSIIKKKKKKHDRILSLAKSKYNSVGF